MSRQIHVRSLYVAVFAAVMMAGGCATSGVNRGDVNVVSLEEEWQLGQQLEADIARQLPVINDAAALNYLNQLGQALVSQSEMANLPWEFHLVADPSINAFNIPGGHVYVHTGLVAAADNAAELAGVMAHEISHGVSRHATEQMSKAYGLNIGASILLGGNPAIYEQILASILAQGAMANFSRSDEREADELGVRYMYEAGYDPMGMATLFEELIAQRQRRPSSLEQFFSTHPLTEDRIRDVTQMAQSLPARSNLRMNDSGFASFKQRLSGYANR